MDIPPNTRLIAVSTFSIILVMPLSYASDASLCQPSGSALAS